MRYWLVLVLLFAVGCTKAPSGAPNVSVNMSNETQLLLERPLEALPVETLGQTFDPKQLEECEELNDACYYKVALNQNNYEYCELISSQGIEGLTKNNCILEIAKKTRDINKCAQVACKSGSFSEMSK